MSLDSSQIHDDSATAQTELLRRLRDRGWVKSPGATLTPLTGGVSSEIYLVRDGAERCVVKRALPKLRVRDDWFADPARNATERACIEYISRVAPGGVPRMLLHDPEAGLFGMEYLDERFENWKTRLLRGDIRDGDAAGAAKLLATVHRHSWGDAAARRQFATWESFFSLRVEPYLLTTGARNPALRSWFEAEAERLRHAEMALVHGDFSPKNLMIGPGRIVLLDCEVAWFGDPAFDAAFLLNHLFLKSLHLSDWSEDFLRLAGVFWNEYFRELRERASPEFAQRVGRLLLLLLLARVDGKSPVEYLTDSRKKDLIRRVATKLLPAGVFALEEITERWRKSVATP